MGYLRFFLMSHVVISHFLFHLGQGGIAVFGFYTLSGLLITLVSCEIYAGTWQGKRYFLCNRFVRIYPTYWACLLIGILCIILTHGALRGLRDDLYLPSGWRNWLPSLAIFGLVKWPSELEIPRPLTESWTLAVELTYYLVIGLITGRSRSMTIAAFILSIANLLRLTLHEHFSFSDLYDSIQGPAPVFFAGSLLYHYRHAIRTPRSPHILRLLGAVLCILYLPALAFLAFHTSFLGYIAYMSVLPTGYCILCFYRLSQRKIPLPGEPWLADISYPMFLLHRPVMGAISYGLTGAFPKDPGIFAIGFMVTCLVSAGVVFSIDRPIKRLRRYFRRRGRGERR